MNDRNNNFNLMRFCLALTVLFTHSYTFVFGGALQDPLNRLTHGQLEFARLAVNVFFVISGILITQSWESSSSAPKFLWKRVRRIYPAFLVAGALCGLVLHPLVAGRGDFYTKVNVPRIMFGLLFLQYWAPLTAIPHLGFATSFNGAIWTIQVEFLCYLSLLIVGAVGLLRFRLTAPVLLALCMAGYVAEARGTSLTGHLFNLYLLPYPQWFFRCTMFFWAGSTAYLFRERIAVHKGIVLSAVALVLGSLVLPGWAEPVQAIAGTYLIWTLAFSHFRPLDFYKSWPDISYGTYLYGWPFQFSLATFLPGLNFWSHVALSVASAGVAGWLSWHGVEKWWLRRRAGNKREDRPHLLANSPQPTVPEK